MTSLLSAEVNQLLENQRLHLNFKTWVLLKSHLHDICYFLFRCQRETLLSTVCPCLSTLVGRKLKCRRTRGRKLRKLWYIQLGPTVYIIMKAELGTTLVQHSYPATRNSSAKSLYSRYSKYLHFSLSLNTVLSFGTFIACSV